MAAQQQAPLDFRFMDEGLGGPNNNKKRKRDESDSKETEDNAEAMQIEEQQAEKCKRQAIGQVYGKPTYDGVISGKVSGRKWKAKARPASALKFKKKTTHEERSRLKQLDKAYKERKENIKEQIRLNKVAKRQKIEELKKRKKERELSGMKVQKITNPKTLKKMSKKQFQKLIRVPDK